MSRLPFRVRLTLGYSIAMALALAATAGVLYLRFESSLNHSIDQTLGARADGLSALLSAAPRARWASILRADADVGQVLSPGGGILAATTSAARRPLLSPAAVRRAGPGRRLQTVGRRPGLGSSTRVLAEPVPRRVGALLVLGTPLREREGANESFSRALLVGGPIALLLAAGLGYALAAGALRPVEAMRRRAATISRLEPGTRLPEPEADDELRRLGATLNDMLSRLEAAAAGERRFVADASHELRTPIAVLRSELELALRRERPPEELRAALEATSRQVLRLGRLADDLLVVARADQGRLPVSPEPLVGREVLEAAAASLSARARELDRSLRVSGEPVPLRADPLRLHQAVTNLVDNALAHGEGEIALRAVSDGDHVELHVEDAGPGFADGFAGEAFERFARAPSVRSHEGAGLGLAIVRAVAEAHDGEAGIGTSSRGGADVWLRLPRGDV